jgi:hypothetical protein
MNNDKFSVKQYVIPTNGRQNHFERFEQPRPARVNIPGLVRSLAFPLYDIFLLLFKYPFFTIHYSLFTNIDYHPGRESKSYMTIVDYAHLAGYCSKAHKQGAS